MNFALTEMRADYDSYTGEVDDDTGGRTGMPVILGWRQVAVQSDVAGLAGINPTPTASGAVEIEIMATAGTAAVQQTEVESMWMITSNWGSNSPAPGGQFAPAGSPVAGPRSSRSLTPLVPRRPRSDRNLQ